MKRVVVINKMDLANENKTLAIVKKIKENDPKLEVMCISTKKNQNVSKLLTFIS
jgi:GTPase Era involved in 16S rRNA processing